MAGSTTGGRRAALLAALAAGLVVRLGAAAWWEAQLPAGQPFGLPDSPSYWALGRAAAEGGPYEFGGSGARVFRAPGYPLLLAPLFWLGRGEPPVFWARVENAVLGVAVAGAVAYWARLLYGPSTAAVAAWVVALHPGSVAVSAVVLSETPFTLWIVLQLACWSRAMLRPTGWSAWAAYAAAGVFGGAAALTRPGWLLFTPLAAAGWWAARPGRDRLLGAVLLVGCSCLVLAPWWIRNYRVTGRFVPGTLQLGASLYDGWNPRADGGSRLEWAEAALKRWERTERPGADEPWEVWADRRLREAALAWARRHPARAAQLVLIKWWRTWRPWPSAAELGGWAPRAAIAAGYLIVVAFAAPECMRALRRGRAWLLVLAPAGYLTAVHGVFPGSIRYRQPAMAALAVCAAEGIRRAGGWAARAGGGRVKEPGS